MLSLPQTQPPRRAARLHLAETTVAVLRFRGGRCIPARLQVLSVTGGLLWLSKPFSLKLGSDAKLMFLIRNGLVLGAVEMLQPISWSLQPFRFVTLHDDDQCRLEAAIHSARDQRRRDRGLVEPGRAW
jgi:hypothetical protein